MAHRGSVRRKYETQEKHDVGRRRGAVRIITSFGLTEVRIIKALLYIVLRRGLKMDCAKVCLIYAYDEGFKEIS